MDYIFALMSVAALIAALIGFVLLFFKARRRRGVSLIGASLVLMIASVAGFSWAIERAAIAEGFLSVEDQRTAEAQGVSSAKEWALQRDAYLARVEAEQQQRLAEAEARAQREQERQRRQEEQEALRARQAEERTREQIATIERAARLGNFPDVETFQTAKSLGIVRFAAYKRLSDKDAIEAYCDYYDGLNALETAKFDAINNGGDEAALSIETEHQMEELRQKYNARFNLIEFELETLANAGNWLIKCRSMQQGLASFDDAHARAVTNKQAKIAVDALTLIYFDQLENGSASNFFRPRGYNLVDCRAKRHEGKQFIGCALVGPSTRSQTHIYLIGQTGEKLGIHPIHGASIQTWRQIWPSVPLAQKRQVAVAQFVQPLGSLAELINLFE